MTRWASMVGSVGALACLVSGAVAAGDPLVKVGRDEICVTDGEVSARPRGGLVVTARAMRAVVPASSRQDIEARFVFLGPTDQTAALGSGAVREQFGLKLRAANPCNLVYAMWRFAPKPGVVVQLKTNPGAHDSQTCHNGGYQTIRPRSAATIGAPGLGETHRLKAEMETSTLTVSIDGKLVWQGEVDGAPADGPVGVRSDNAKLALELFAPIGSGPPGGPQHCRAAGEE